MSRRAGSNGTAARIPIGEGRSVPVLGPVRKSPRGNWQAKVVLPEEGGCQHDRKKREQQAYGTQTCKDCDATRGPDGLWRVLVAV